MARTTDAEIQAKLKKFDFKKAEVLEIKKEYYQTTDYPAPVRTYRIEFEAENYNVEEMYYWLVGHLHYDFGLQDMIKIVDTHAHSAGSALFGDLQARLGAQQSNVSNYMGMMGRLIKDLFAIVRELRQLEERLTYYTDAADPKSKHNHSAEATLKDIWITLVEGGSQNPSSVYGMAQKVGFTILPDLFFAAKPLTRDAVDEHVERLDFNESVKNALRRKLFQFTTWKEETHKELTNSRNFKIKYLRQHYEVIKMYMEWIKPYIRNIQRLNLNEDRMDNDAFLVHAFDTSASEIEVLMYKLAKKFDTPQKDKDGNVLKDKDGNELTESYSESAYSVVLLTFTFHTKPQILIRAPESYQQKGAVHTGHVDMIMRCYGWNGTMIDNYKKYRESQVWDFIKSFDTSIKDAMDYLGEDLKKYIDVELGKLPTKEEKKKDEKKKEDEGPNQLKETMNFIGGPFNGLKELLDPIFGISNLFGMFEKDKNAPDPELVNAKEAALKAAGGTAQKLFGYQAYKNYKKAHKMTHW